MPRPLRRPPSPVDWPTDLYWRTWQAFDCAAAHGFDETATTDDPLHPRREWLAAVYAVHRSTFVADFERADATHPLGYAPASSAFPVACFEPDGELRDRAIDRCEKPHHHGWLRWWDYCSPDEHPWR
jgi:hypothetical protein